MSEILPRDLPALTADDLEALKVSAQYVLSREPYTLTRVERHLLANAAVRYLSWRNRPQPSRSQKLTEEEARIARECYGTLELECDPYALEKTIEHVIISRKIKLRAETDQ